MGILKNKIFVTITAIILVTLGYFLFVVTPETIRTPETVNIDIVAISSEVALGDAILLDVRTSEERATDGYAAGSTHFDISRLEAGEYPNVDSSTIIYTYCKAGARAEKAKGILKKGGFENVTCLGGLSDWEAAGGEIVR